MMILWLGSSFLDDLNKTKQKTDKMIKKEKSKPETKMYRCKANLKRKKNIQKSNNQMSAKHEKKGNIEEKAFPSLNKKCCLHFEELEPVYYLLSQPSSSSLSNSSSNSAAKSSSPSVLSSLLNVATLVFSAPPSSSTDLGLLRLSGK